MKKILKIAVVLLIAVAMVMSTVAVTADTDEEMNEKCLKTTNQNPVVNPTQPALGPVIFSQIPYEPDETWGFYSSTTYSNPVYLCKDDFWDLEEPICDIHWWGLSLVNPWAPCDPTGMQFEIIFYDNSGAPVCVYTVTPTAVPTGKIYSGFEMYYWETDLNPCCPLNAGWVSIQNIFSPNQCWFLWAGSPATPKNALQNDAPLDDSLAFELTAGEEPCIPSIDVEKYVWDPELGEWLDADTADDALDLPICTDVSFKIVIHNDGECDLYNIIVKDWMHDSLKFLSADPEPDHFEYTPPEYYMEWFFPGPLMPDETIEIYITAHVEGPDSSRDYNRVKVEGTAEEHPGEPVTDQDEAWVHAFEKSRTVNRPILNWLQIHPNMFPMLRLILQRFRL